MRQKAWVLIPLWLMATGCCAVASGKIKRIEPSMERKVNVMCCLVKKGDVFVEVKEDDALNFYSPGLRFYYMDGDSWGNLLKNTAEKNGIIRQYEKYPCVQE